MNLLSFVFQGVMDSSPLYPAPVIAVNVKPSRLCNGPRQGKDIISSLNYLPNSPVCWVDDEPDCNFVISSKAGAFDRLGRSGNPVAIIFQHMKVESREVFNQAFTWDLDSRDKLARSAMIVERFADFHDL